MRRLHFFSSLYGRIFAIFWLTLLLVLLAVLAAPHFDPRAQHTIAPEHIKRMKNAAHSISEQYQGPGDIYQKVQQITEHSHKKKGMFKLYFTSKKGELLNSQERNRSKALRNFITISDDPIQPQQKLYGRWMMAGPFEVRLAEQDVLMYVGRLWREPPPFLIKILDRPFQLLLVTMLVSTPLLLWLAWALSQPARRLQQAATRVAQGQFETDPNLEKGTREFRHAGTSFNQMVQALNTMISGQQRLLSDISHELRSPLTRLRMATALATRKQGESSELSRIDTEAERLEKMISELLELSRMQINSHQDRQKIDAHTLWFNILDDAQFEAEQSGKKLDYSEPKAWPMMGNPNLLMSAVENVIRNAIRYGNDHIEVAFSETNNQLTITVDDNGEGVPESELEDIFRPFYRVSTARDRSSGGTGLGLAITENAIRQHSGTIKASKSVLGGLRMTITLPLNKE